jgi:pimeloyl-ACP methyl ester carboxylesterase
MNAAQATHPSKTLVLLPGLDGTGRLFAPLLAVLPPSYRTVILSYPTGKVLGYDALCARVVGELPKSPHVLLAESFSGPVALMVAQRKPEGLKAVILVASFAANPRPWLSLLLGRFVGAWCFRRAVPTWALRPLVVGTVTPVALCEEIRESLKLVNPAVLAHRLQEVMRSDATAALRGCTLPIFYLNGTRDWLLGPTALRHILAARPDVTVADTEGPHMLLQATPRAAAHHIGAALESLDW